MTSNHEIFFSYAWDDDESQGNGKETIVNELYYSLINDNFRVIRDKYNLQYKGLISEFILRLGKGRFIIVAISEKYLKSHYCMFELYEIARNSNLDQQKFTEKVLPVMVEFVDFTNPPTIEFYLSYWENEFEVWDKLVRCHSGNLSAEQLQRYHNVKLIFQNFGMLTEWIIDMNLLNLKILSAGNFAKIKNEINKRDPEIVSAYGRVAAGLRIGLVAIIIIVLAGLGLIAKWTPPLTKDHTPAKEVKIESNSNTDTTLRIVNGLEEKTTSSSSNGPGLSKDPVKTKKNDKVAANPGMNEVEPGPLMCLAVCNTKGIRGVEVSFLDERSNKKYLKVSDGGAMEFDIPCYLKEGPIRVSFKKGQGPAEHRNVQLIAFEIPELFMTN